MSSLPNSGESSLRSGVLAVAWGRERQGACSIQHGSQETSQPHHPHAGTPESQSRCHGSASAAFSSAALLCASGSVSPLCHSCLPAPLSTTGFPSQPPAEPAGIQIASSWARTPCSRRMDTCTAGCIDTATEHKGSVSMTPNSMDLTCWYRSYPTMQISLALRAWAWKRWGQGK